MSSNPNIERIFQNRRTISVSENSYEKYPDKNSRAVGARHPTKGPNPSSNTTSTRDTPDAKPRHATRTGGEASGRQVDRLRLTPSSSSFGPYTVDRYLAFPNTGHPQSVCGNTSGGGQGVMAGRSDTGSYSQMNLPLSFGVPTGLGHRANIQSHDPFDSSRLLPFSILDWLSPVIVKIDRNLPNSWVYRDVLEEVLEDADLKRLVRPWPPGQYTVTRPGYDPKGGHYVDLTLRNKSTIRTGAGRDVRLPLTILTRERRDGNDIGVVLCQDYLQRFAATPSIQIGIEQSLAGMHPPNATQQVWQTIAQPQNVPGLDTAMLDPDLDNGLGYIIPTWPRSNDEMQGVHMQSQNLAPPSTNTFASSHGSTGFAYSSATSPMENSNLAFHQDLYPSSSWQQPEDSAP